MAKCRVCDTGYHLDNFECPMNECTCQNGVAVVGPVSNDGELCETHGAAKCLSCDDGHYFDNYACPEKQCNCLDGTGRIKKNINTIISFLKTSTFF